ncbi:MAG: radical SAM protein [Firmicutes bacterium]|nr:radical SAM protein [Bacillota bacterium]
MTQRKIYLHYPSQTKPVSVTGTECKLQCRHCAGHYLKSMADAGEAEKLCAASYLISGGCDSKGAVPLWEHLDLLETLKKNGSRLNLHTGLIPFEHIESVAKLADTVSFDFTTDDETISEVYGFEASADDYIKTIVELKKYTSVIPHITIGILGGKTAGEINSVKKLAELGFKRIVFIVFIPTRNTPYEKCSPPSLSDVEEILKQLHLLMPGGSFGLGCMHPRGDYKIKLEKLTFDYGFDSFVNPSKSFTEFLQTLGNQVITERREECCVL